MEVWLELDEYMPIKVSWICILFCRVYNSLTSTVISIQILLELFSLKKEQEQR